jgi:4-aminobutyrate aminotransferase-like enzyme
VRAFPFPDGYRAPADVADLGAHYLAGVEAAIAELNAAGDGVAALIVCPIFANEGLAEPPPGFLAEAAARVRAAGGLIVIDEVQAGYGRTGDWWGYQRAGIAPDIVVTGKPMGNGLPLSATAASRSLVEAFRARTRYFNTFAASPLQAAAGLAVLDVIADEGLLDNARRVGEGLKRSLQARVDRFGTIGEVRGAGLFLGIDMVRGPDDRAPNPELAVETVNRLKDRGFLTSNAGAYANVIKIRPPLVFAEADAAAFLDAFDAVMVELNG